MGQEKFNIPDEYFDNLDKEVVKVYHKRKRLRNLRNISFSLFAVVVAFSIVQIFNNNNLNQPDLLSQSNNALLQMPVDKISSQSATLSEDDIKTVKQQDLKTSLKTTNKAQKHSTTLTNEELDYIATYLYVDNYELLSYANIE